MVRTLASLAPTHVDPNENFGIKTDYGWYTIPKKYYAHDWTIPQIHKAIKDKYENPTNSQIQSIIDKWCKDVKLSTKPKHTKFTKADIVKLEHQQLFERQMKPLLKARRKEERALLKEQKKKEAEQKRRQFTRDRNHMVDYVLEHGVYPPDFDFSTIKLTQAWNHFSTKNYIEGPMSHKEKKLIIGNKWNELTPEEKEEVRQEHIELLKKGLCYNKGKLIPIKTKYVRSKYVMKIDIPEDD